MLGVKRNWTLLDVMLANVILVRGAVFAQRSGSTVNFFLETFTLRSATNAGCICPNILASTSVATCFLTETINSRIPT
jgi:hypothetical protein